MHVVATREGFFGNRVRKPGETFTLTDPTQLSKRWMLDTATPEGEAFLRAASGDKGLPKMNRQHDRLTGERLAAGGITEQLAITLEENTRLKAELAELRAERDILLANIASSQAPTASTQEAEAADKDEQENSAPQRVRRRVTS